MVGRDQEAAPKPDGRTQSNTTSILLASTPPMPSSWSMTDPPVEGLCLRTANARTRAWPLSQVSQVKFSLGVRVSGMIRVRVDVGVRVSNLLGSV